LEWKIDIIAPKVFSRDETVEKMENIYKQVTTKI
jgi:hypothetical protein